MLSAVVVESVWIYAAVAAVALMMLPGGSPISWIAALIIMLVSFAVARTLGLIIMPLWMPYAIQMLAGTVTVYVILGTQIPSAGQWLDLGWLSDVFADITAEHFVRSAAIGGFFSALFWLRGGRLASTELPVEHLNLTFRLGLIVLSIAAIVDIFNDADLKIFALMFVFFAAGLTGLSIGHIRTSQRRPSSQLAWFRVIGIVVGAIIVMGFLFSLLQRGVLTFISTPLLFILSGVGKAVFFVVVVPIAYIMQFIVMIVFWLLLKIVGEPQEQEQEIQFGVQDILDQFPQNNEPTEPSIWLQILGAVAIAIVVSVLLFILARAFRRRLRWRRIDEEGDRESLTDGFDPLVDMARLLFDLLPERFRRRRVDSKLRLPDDEPGIVDVFRIYFGMLEIGESRGEPRKNVQTPVEYQSTLARLLPERLVEMATAAFNRACYGRQASTAQEIDDMQQLLEEAANNK